MNDEQDRTDDGNADYEDDDPVPDDNYDDEEEEEEEDKKHPVEEPTPAPMSLTEYKWKYYGTRSRVEESRRNQVQLQTGNNNGELWIVVL